MIESLSPLTRKIVAVGLLVVLVLGVLTLAILPLSDHYSHQAAAIADSRRQIAAYRQVLARAPALKARLEQIRRNPNYRKGFLPAESPVLAAARLENMLKDIVRQSGGTMRSTRIQPQKGEPADRVRVTVDFSADPQAVLTAANRIVGAVPYLTTDNVQIRGTPSRKDGPPQMTVRMDVEAYIWRGTP